ncbi:hypothetical protein EM88_023790 [Vibrio parahaemolyticus]|nr:hypothetical protein EM88_023790 [Vibrio parahaemolyticus]
MAFLVCVGFSVYGALQRLLYCVPAPLNAALVANEKIAAKTECLGLIVRVLCLILHFELRDLGSRKLSFVLFLV